MIYYGDKKQNQRIFALENSEIIKNFENANNSKTGILISEEEQDLKSLAIDSIKFRKLKVNEFINIDNNVLNYYKIVSHKNYNRTYLLGIYYR
jgi:hypothetical protein